MHPGLIVCQSSALELWVTKQPVCTHNALQVSKTVVQDDFEAGTLQLSVSAAATSGQGTGRIAVQGSASAAVQLPQIRSMAVAIALSEGQSSAVSVAGACTMFLGFRFHQMITHDSYCGCTLVGAYPCV
jgi:hypothetical protein